MNYELLQKHIDSAVGSIQPQKMKSDGSNAFDYFVADVIGNRKFGQNYAGYHRSEIAELNAATTEAQMKAILNTLTDYSPKDNPNAGRSDAEIMLAHKSKYQQAPTELQGYIKDQLLQRDAARQAAYEAAVAAQAAQAAKAAKKNTKSVPADPE